MERSFLESTTPHAILKYSSRTAGHEVSYLIEHEYAGAYDRAIETSPDLTDRSGCSSLARRGHECDRPAVSTGAPLHPLKMHLAPTFQNR
jgi:hypothetical protein